MMQGTRFLLEQRRRGRRPRQSGFTLMEVAMALIIFTMMTLMFGAVLPIAVRGAGHGDNYSQAAALAQRKVDQLRSAGYSRLFDGSSSALSQLSAQNIVDGQNGPSGAMVGGTYDFTTVDHMTGTGGFFPAGSTGTITIKPYTNPSYNNSGASEVAQVIITLNWTGTVPGSYTASALIVKMLHQ